MSSTIYNSRIWQTTLAEGSSYAQKHSEDVAILRNSFKGIRKKAEYIAGLIQQSQPGLTLHDITHLDALWETAETIGGEKLELNPVEAYVFGCAVLFHDLGMALALWEEQLPTLKHSEEYKAILFEKYCDYLGRTPEIEDYEHLPDVVEQATISTRLRELHAVNAKKLPFYSWKFNEEFIYLIEQNDLREKLGHTIGTIAESHWWDVEEIRSTFAQRQISAAPTSFSFDWTVNNVKLACLLRLSDFIHIDDRRAPTLALATLKPTGISLQHWTFQNKLDRAFRDKVEERLTFQSHTNFKYEDHQAWWLAYTTIRSIDLELRAVDNLLSDLDIQRFAARGVYGIEAPSRFSAFVRTEDWEPADSQFKISNIRNIIEKLGGSQLYGNRPDVPLRELIQNAADALNAKKLYRKDNKGVINVRYYLKDGTEWLEVEDNGIGMSKSALLYGLLDFGNSFWKSPLLRQEHPRLVSEGFKPTGEFGIGFFSVFMISDFIQIISKSVSRGASTLILEFGKGLSETPILKTANEHEERVESGTLVRMSCKKEGLITRILKQFGWTETKPMINPLVYICQHIGPALPFDVICTFENEEPLIASIADDWKTIDPVTLLLRISNYEFAYHDEDLTKLSKYISPIFNHDGNEMVARGTILPFPGRGSDHDGIAKITVGGLVQASIKSVTGVWLGKNSVISRNFATPICSYKELLPWLDAQNKLIISDFSVEENDKVAVSNMLCSLGFTPKGLPLTFINGKWYTYDEVLAMDHGDHVLIERLVNGDNAFRGLVGPHIYATVGNPVRVGVIVDGKKEYRVFGN